MLRLCQFRLNLTPRRRWLSSLDALETLGLKEHASKKEIRNAFIEKAKVYHPDNAETGNVEHFREIEAANKRLEDYHPKPYRKPEKGAPGTAPKGKFFGQKSKLW